MTVRDTGKDKAVSCLDSVDVVGSWIVEIHGEVSFLVSLNVFGGEKRGVDNSLVAISTQHRGPSL